MGICKWCKKEMNGADSCVQEVSYPDGVVMPAIPYNPNDGEDENQRCHDCGIKRGGLHHPGCDMEICPRCGGQLISCGCLDQAAEVE